MGQEWVVLEDRVLMVALEDQVLMVALYPGVQDTGVNMEDSMESRGRSTAFGHPITCRYYYWERGVKKCL